MKKIKLQAKRLSTAIAFVILAVLMTSFLLDTAAYGLYSWSLHSIEKEAEEGVWTSNGLVHWTQSQVETYKEVSANRDDFIESHDTAAFLYHSGFSTLGQVLRVATILVAAIVLVISIKLSVQLVKLVIKSLSR